jgi:hypothetical protein
MSVFGIACLVIFGIIFSFLPTITAFRKHHESRFAIMLTNIFLGWTIVGWFIAMFWSMSKQRVAIVTQTHGPVRS